ncbi:hypothetical protein NBE98_05435 [Clostridium swellfunianum]|nr:hypothetical protein [Clostridium swellfunianum]MCM0647817.1 hypothetical protein [Clostridium swellfunianum]
MILGAATVIGAVTIIVIAACFKATGISINATKIEFKNTDKDHSKYI